MDPIPRNIMAPSDPRLVAPLARIYVQIWKISRNIDQRNETSTDGENFGMSESHDRRKKNTKPIPRLRKHIGAQFFSLALDSMAHPMTLA
jgi:hypothetical protein